MVNESIRHFRALRRIPGGTKVLYNEGNCGDPLSLYLRSLCLDGELQPFYISVKSGKAPVSVKLFLYELWSFLVEMLHLTQGGSFVLLICHKDFVVFLTFFNFGICFMDVSKDPLY
jgi:hypothetical protein